MSRFRPSGCSVLVCKSTVEGRKTANLVEILSIVRVTDPPFSGRKVKQMSRLYGTVETSNRRQDLQGTRWPWALCDCRIYPTELCFKTGWILTKVHGYFLAPLLTIRSDARAYPTSKTNHLAGLRFLALAATSQLRRKRAAPFCISSLVVPHWHGKCQN